MGSGEEDSFYFTFVFVFAKKLQRKHRNESLGQENVFYDDFYLISVTFILFL